MKYYLSTALLLVFILAANNTQANPADSIPFLQKLLHSPNAGLVWRLYTGFAYTNQYFRGAAPAAAAPIVAETGYKFRFVELGYCRRFGGLPLGMDSPIRLSGFDSGVAIGQPLLARMSAHQLYGALHFSFLHTPLFVKGGMGSWRAARVPALWKFASGAERWTSYSSETAFGTMIGIGFSQNNFFAAFEMHVVDWDDQRFVEKPGHIFSLTMGCQFAAPGGRALNNRSIDFEERLFRISLSVGRSAFMAPWKERAAAGKMYYEAAVKVHPQWNLALAFHPWADHYGYDKQEPAFYQIYGPQFQSVALFNGTLSHVRHWQLRTDYYFDPYRNVKWLLSAGAGRYRIEQVGGYRVNNGNDVPPAYEAHKTLGIILGGGFDFRLFQSRLLFHKTASEFPAFLEWHIGLKLSFLKMRG